MRFIFHGCAWMFFYATACIGVANLFGRSTDVGMVIFFGTFWIPLGIFAIVRYRSSRSKSAQA